MIYVHVYSHWPDGWYYQALDSKKLDEGIFTMKGVLPEQEDVQEKIQQDFAGEEITAYGSDLQYIEGELAYERQKDREGKARLTGWQSNDTMLACRFCDGPIRWNKNEPGEFGGAWGQVYHSWATCSECKAEYVRTSLPDYTRYNSNELLVPTWEAKKDGLEYNYEPKDYEKAQMWREILAGTR